MSNGKNRSRSWFLTLPDEPLEDLTEKLSSYSYIGQQEQGEEATIKNENGYLHFHIFIDTDNPVSFRSLKKKLPNAHIEIPQNKLAVYKYVTKTDTATGIRIENNFPHDRYKNKSLSLKPIEQISQIVKDNPNLTYFDFLKEYPSLFGGYWSRTAKELIYARKLDKQTGTSRNVDVHYIYGKTGVGKSRYIAENFNRKEVYRVTNRLHPFDGYNGQDVLVFEEFTGQFAIEDMLIWLDRYWIDLPARYENKPALYTKVFILTNVPFSELYPEVQDKNPEQFQAFKRRFTAGVYEMNNDGLLQLVDA